MKIHQLKDATYTSNVYLIEADMPVLVDTGGSLKERIIEWVPEILGDRKLTQIVFTHGHGDHVNSAAEIASHFNVPFFIHSADSELLPEAKPLGETLDCGDVKFEIIHTPGHSHGGVCLYDLSQRILISGDTIFPGGRTGRWDLKTANYDDLVKSVTKLLQLEIDSLYPGHYDPIDGNVHAHLSASLETLKLIGPNFDDQLYDDRIAELSTTLP